MFLQVIFVISNASFLRTLMPSLFWINHYIPISPGSISDYNSFSTNNLLTFYIKYIPGVPKKFPLVSCSPFLLMDIFWDTLYIFSLSEENNF